MSLSQEYINRHSLEHPIIQSANDDYLIFKVTSNKSKWKESGWVIFHIYKRQDHQWRAPHYEFSLHVPSHNSFDNVGQFLSCIERNEDVVFNDYDLQIFKYISKFKGLTPVVDLAEAKIATWEMFALSYDRVLSAMKQRHLNSFYNSLDPDLSLSERMENQIAFLNMANRDIVSKWRDVSYICNPNSYSDWYGTLINNVRSKKFLIKDYSNNLNALV